MFGVKGAEAEIVLQDRNCFLQITLMFYNLLKEKKVTEKDILHIQIIQKSCSRVLETIRNVVGK